MKIEARSTVLRQVHAIFSSGLKLSQLGDVGYFAARHPMNTGFASHKVCSQDDLDS